MSNDGQRRVSVTRTIPAPAEAIFAVLTDPARHCDIDGSGSVKKARWASETPLALGSRFGMAMRIGAPYRITNVVVEYEPGRLIAWRHFGGHRWRYELEPVDGGTRVTETFDWSTARFPKVIELVGYPSRHPASMEKTLERLEQVVAEGAET